MIMIMALTRQITIGSIKSTDYRFKLLITYSKFSSSLLGLIGTIKCNDCDN